MTRRPPPHPPHPPRGGLGGHTRRRTRCIVGALPGWHRCCAAAPGRRHCRAGVVRGGGGGGSACVARYRRRRGRERGGRAVRGQRAAVLRERGGRGGCADDWRGGGVSGRRGWVLYGGGGVKLAGRGVLGVPRAPLSRRCTQRLGSGGRWHPFFFHPVCVFCLLGAANVGAPPPAARSVGRPRPVIKKPLLAVAVSVVADYMRRARLHRERSRWLSSLPSLLSV